MAWQGEWTGMAVPEGAASRKWESAFSSLFFSFSFFSFFFWVCLLMIVLVPRTQLISFFWTRNARARERTLGVFRAAGRHCRGGSIVRRVGLVLVMGAPAESNDTAITPPPCRAARRSWGHTMLCWCAWQCCAVDDFWQVQPLKPQVCFAQ